MVAQRHAAFAEESAEVEVLYASLDKMKSVSKKIQGSMSRLNETGRTVQDAIGPIYGNTQRLQAQNMNVDRILQAIEKVKQPLDMRNREERILSSMPDKVGLTEYIASMDRTNQALRELKTTNLRSNQVAISELSSLLATGAGNLENVFRDMLRQDSQPIEPLKQITTSQDFPRIASGKSAQLRTINTNISNYHSQVGPQSELTHAGKVYAHERGQYIALSLQNLASATLSTAKKSQADAIYRPGTCAITTYATALQGMVVAEYDSICPVFQREEWGAVLRATLQDAMKTFTGTLRDLDVHIRAHQLTDCYLGYEIIDVVTKMGLAIEQHTSELKQVMYDALKPVRETSKKSLSFLLNDTRGKVGQMLQIPADAAALPVTPDVMARLQTMTAYLVPLASIMRSLGDGGWNQPSNTGDSSSSVPTMKSFDVGADGKQLFAHYSADTIETLISSLDAKARSLQKSKSLQGVFLANNIAVVERMIRASELATLLGSAQAKVDSWKKKSTQMYLDGWKESAAHLLDVGFSNKLRPTSTGHAVDSSAIVKSLTSKDKDAVKEKFKNFNTSFEELVARHKTYKMELEVRRQLGRDAQMFIEPLYARFWDKYHEVDKGKGKYVKFDKSQLSAMLAGLS